MVRKIFVIGIILGAVVGYSRPLGAQPTTAPSTEPGTVPVVPADPTTPKGTLMLLSRAMQEGDTAAMRRLLNITNPSEQKVADAVLRKTEASTAFRKASVKTFGADAANQLADDPAAQSAAWEQQIAQADVKIDNNKATVDAAPAPINLVKVGGNWKVSMDMLMGKMTDAQIDQEVQKTKTIADVATQTADEMNQGKYKTPEEVIDVMRARLAKVLLENPTAAQQQGQPTTSP